MLFWYLAYYIQKRLQYLFYILIGYYILKKGQRLTEVTTVHIIWNDQDGDNQCNIKNPRLEVSIKPIITTKWNKKKQIMTKTTLGDEVRLSLLWMIHDSEWD